MSRAARPGRTVEQVGEFAILARFVQPAPRRAGLVIGPGHDCAVLDSRGACWLLTVDALVEGVHFKTNWLSPRQIGRKSFLVNASDVAAMGGRPRWCAVSIGVPPAYPVAHLHQVQSGIVAAARACGATVAGGNLARSRELFVSLTLLAEAPRRLVARHGAQRGDRIYVTGTLGDAALGLRLLRNHAPTTAGRHAVRRFREPAPRLRAGRTLVEAGIASAMIDVSDGLVQDLGHICAASGVGAVIRAADVPLSAAYRSRLGSDDLLALYGGEDYELLCTVPDARVKRLHQLAARLDCAITCIGEVTDRRGVHVLGRDGRKVKLAGGGYDHFHRSR